MKIFGKTKLENSLIIDTVRSDLNVQRLTVDSLSNYTEIYLYLEQQIQLRDYLTDQINLITKQKEGEMRETMNLETLTNFLKAIGQAREYNHDTKVIGKWEALDLLTHIQTLQTENEQLKIDYIRLQGLYNGYYKQVNDLKSEVQTNKKNRENIIESLKLIPNCIYPNTTVGLCIDFDVLESFIKKHTATERESGWYAVKYTIDNDLQPAYYSTIGKWEILGVEESVPESEFSYISHTPINLEG